MSTPVAPVLIVGAGPAGLVLALTLQKNRIPVRIIDKDPQYHTGQRGAGIQPRTLDLYNLLGVLPDILAKGTPMAAIRIYKLPGGTEPIKTVYINPHEEPTAAIPHPNTWLLGQTSAEAILRSHLAQYNCYVELGTELRGLEQHPDHVLAHVVKKNGAVEEQESVACRWLIGTDGARGIVRKLLEFELVGETRVERAIVGEIGLKGLEKGYMHTWGDHSSLRILLRATENEGEFCFGIVGNLDHAKVVADREELIRVIRQGTDRDDFEFGELRWITDFQANVRMVEKLSEGRVFLAGVPRADRQGELNVLKRLILMCLLQGMNSSVQDAFNLGWKLALAEKSLASPSLLSTYGEERLPVIAEMLKETTKLLEQRVAAQRDGSGSEAAWNAGDLMKQLTINYRWSSIVRDERVPAGEKSAVDPYGLLTAKGDPIRAGDRAPDAPGLVDASTAGGDATSLSRVFGPSSHTVLVFSADIALIDAAVKAIEAYSRDIIHVVVIRPQDATNVVIAVGTAYMDLIDREGHAYKNYSVAAGGFTAVIVRPDGVVGGIVSGGKGLKGYFDTIFSI
ncbi:monooxygenase [Wolfiporia cocos MD-104 SS10]|uniref:Monooxygenase n=1 Tax=Wolfiporia cocos (strain MD-104) TaxID=742152 RepID=A0A2H3J385_WOLCO|nr:monooxygenase [Wolfiporia cocos MD-104 SS10]